MKEILLVKYGEIILKGLNRHTFEDCLIYNIKVALKSIGHFNVSKQQSVVYIEEKNNEANIDLAFEKLTKIFGIVWVSRAIKLEKDMEVIKTVALEALKDKLSYKTFKVEAKRSDKKFPLKSPEISAEVGGFLFENIENAKVDVVHPEITVVVEIRDDFSYIHWDKKKGAGGIPTGMGGNVMLLLSGGIDSPVAGFMMAKRGATVSAVHFHSYPYTSERAKEKVIDLAKILSGYSMKLKLYVVPFTKIQLELNKNCAEDLMTIIMRRFMMKISERVATNNDCLALITGESLGQVASQTLKGIYVTDHASTIPVFRPLIGMDKEEIVEIARKIGTFETSILPYEDCCTVFLPKHPKTNPKLENVLEEEKKVNIEELISEAVENTEMIVINEF